MKVPGVTKAGSSCRRVVEGPDIYPSLLDVCGLPKAEHVEGVSFAPLLKAPETSWKKGSLIYREMGKAVGLVTEQWRYNRFEGQPERDQLFDHQTDPAENINLIKDSKYAAVVKELGTLMDSGWKGCLPTSAR